MKDLLARLTTFDWFKLSLYGVAACGAITVALLNTILKPWDVPDAVIASLSAKIGSISAIFGLIGVIATAIKNAGLIAPPKGYANVITPKADTPISDPRTIAQPSVLTTADAVKKGP